MIVWGGDEKLLLLHALSLRSCLKSAGSATTLSTFAVATFPSHKEA